MGRKPKEQLPQSGKQKLKKAEKAVGKGKGKLATWLKMGRFPEYLVGQMLEADGMQCLAKQLEKCHVTDINLSHNKLGDEGMKFLCNALRVNQTIRKLNVSANNIGDGGGLAFGSILAKNRILEEVWMVGNQLTDCALQAIALALRIRQDPENHVTVTMIDLSWNNIGHRGCEAVRKAMERCRLPHNGQSYARFQVLLGGQAGPIKREGAREHMGPTGIGDEGCTQLCEGMRECGLKDVHHSLALWHNDIGKEGAQAVASLIGCQELVTDCNLSWNSLGPDGVEMIGQAIVGPTALRTLNLSHNIVGSKGGVAIAGAIARGLPSLTSINLSHNELEDAASTALAKSLVQNTTLKKLDLSYNPLGDEGALSWCETVEHNKHLISVNLGGCNLDVSVTDKLRGALKLSPKTLFRNEPGAEMKQEKAIAVHGLFESAGGHRPGGLIGSAPRGSVDGGALSSGGRRRSSAGRGRDDLKA